MAKSFNDVLSGPFKALEVRPPRQVLEELASSLRQKADYALSFEVVTSTSDERAMHSLRVSVRRLDYELEVISVSHKVLELYPVRVSGLLLPAVRQVNSEDELFDVLADAFNSDRAKEIMGTLLVQAKA
jgi:hypothetical protein